MPDYKAVPLPIWRELLVGVEMAFLRVSPVYYGLGIPRGDQSAVVVIPGFLTTDFYLTEFTMWLRRIGYQSYFSGIGLNAECPNLLITRRLNRTIDKAYEDTSRRVHIIGHSLGGVIARAAAAQRPDRVASVITLGAPFRGVRVHPSILRAAQVVRTEILHQHGEGVLPGCYTGRCSCDFIDSLIQKFPDYIPQAAIYSKNDGIVDWRVCITGDPAVDCEVTGTHIGMVFNPVVYEIVAKRLAASRPPEETRVPPPRPSRRRRPRGVRA